MKRIACIGECMVEMAHKGPDELQLGYGGDTLNTAIYLNRLMRDSGVTVDYVTALGDDDYSESMLSYWKEEGLGTDLVTRLPGHLPGLYTIRTDSSGERSFSYWREQSAARKLFEGDRARLLSERLQGYDLVYFSGITLSILDPAQRMALIRVIESVREAGGKVAFDGNFRPSVWPSLQEAKASFDDVLARTDIALPTFEDERALLGPIKPEEVAIRLHDLGVGLVVVKLGAKGCLLSIPDKRDIIATSPVSEVIDSTAAGDSFNAGFLASIMLDKAPRDAALDGHKLAGRVLSFRGAIIPNDAMPNHGVVQANMPA